MTHPCWVALHGMGHSFIELDKAVVHVITLISFSVIVVFILSAFWLIRIRGLWKLPDGRDWLRGKLGLVLMGRSMLSKSLIQFSVDGWGCVPSLFDLRPNCPLETLGHSQASPTQSLVGTLLLSPGSWGPWGIFCALQESASPFLWKFCNQIPLASRVKFPEGSQSFCWFPKLENPLWVLELS